MVLISEHFGRAAAASRCRGISLSGATSSAERNRGREIPAHVRNALGPHALSEDLPVSYFRATALGGKGAAKSRKETD